MKISVDGGPSATESAVVDPLDIHRVIMEPPQAAVSVPLRAGEEIGLTARYTWTPDLLFFRAGLAVQEPRLPADEEFARAVEAARAADVAVVVVGTTEAIESEGYDREHLRLPGRQDDLVRAVAAVNSRTVVVVYAGAPMLMPWRDEVAAILLAWFPGMEFGNALADVLTGAVEPGGRLPTTWPGTEGGPSVTPAGGVLEYAEGPHIGHRAHLQTGTEPAYWFGAGQGYTHREYESLADDGRDARVVLRNAGDRPGKEVVQVYLSRPDSAIDRPARWLAGFATVRAGPGERVEVTVPIAERAFQHWTNGGWATEPGEFTVSVGRSAADMVASTKVVR